MRRCTPLASLAGPILAAAGLGLLGLAGCGGGHVAESSAPTSPVAPMTAGFAARAVKNEHPGSVVAQGSGASMRPLYGDNTLLVIAPVKWEDLHAGMEVAYRSPAGKEIVHTLVRRQGDNWIARGFNNASDDPHPVTRDNLIGVVYGTFRTAAAGE